MFDENSPEMRTLLAPYEDSIARFDAKMDAIGDEFAQNLTEYQKFAAERDQAQAAQLAQVLEQEKAENAAKAPQDQWVVPREPKPTVMTFGEQEDEDPPPAQWTAPTPPMGFTPPPLPPIPPLPEPPSPEPVPQDTDRLMSFVFDEDDEPAPPQQPAQGRRRARTDDDDMPGQSWLT